ncbi:MAG TPA: GDSL-type esterase/lipase family protein, partial [Saprospiraceae bacterium]|nr:GDSL-type esterase/lipase family protein [Saprospiraceae bacterium]
MNDFLIKTYLEKSITTTIFIMSLLCQSTVLCQVKEPNFNDSLFSTYYHQKVSILNVIPTQKNEIIFLGNSITDSGEWATLFDDHNIVNMGISGDVTQGVLHRLKFVLKRKPSKIFLLIGTNDLARGITVDSVLNNILWIADYIHERLPTCKLYIQSILPVNDHFGKFSGHTKNASKILEINQKLHSNQRGHYFTYIDLHSHFTDEKGKLREELSNDGLHPMGNVYQTWKHIIYPYVYDLSDNPSLIPQPQSIEWNKSIFPLYQCTSICINSPKIAKEATSLQSYLSGKGIETVIRDKNK